MVDIHEQAGPRPNKRSYGTMAGEDKVSDAHHEAAHTHDPASSALPDDADATDHSVSDHGNEVVVVAGGEHEDGDVEGGVPAEDNAEGEDEVEEQTDAVEAEDEDEDEEGDGIAGDTATQGNNGTGNIPGDSHTATQWTPRLRAMARREIRSVRRRIQREDYAESRAVGEWGSMLFAHAAAVAGAERVNGDADDEDVDDEVDELEDGDAEAAEQEE